MMKKKKQMTLKFHLINFASRIFLVAFLSSHPAFCEELEFDLPKSDVDRFEWFSKNSNKLHGLIKQYVYTPDNLPDIAIRKNGVEIFDRIPTGISYSVVLACLGFPSKIIYETGSSGPPEMPRVWLVYPLVDSEKELVITLQLGDDLRSVVMINKSLSDKKTESQAK